MAQTTLWICFLLFVLGSLRAGQIQPGFRGLRIQSPEEIPEHPNATAPAGPHNFGASVVGKAEDERADPKDHGAEARPKDVRSGRFTENTEERPYPFHRKARIEADGQASTDATPPVPVVNTTQFEQPTTTTPLPSRPTTETLTSTTAASVAGTTETSTVLAQSQETVKTSLNPSSPTRVGPSDSTMQSRQPIYDPHTGGYICPSSPSLSDEQKLSLLLTVAKLLGIASRTEHSDLDHQQDPTAVLRSLVAGWENQQLTPKAVKVEALPVPLPGITVCGDGEGICVNATDCAKGRSIGTCANCVSCTTCCKYEYQNGGETSRALAWFQSPGYPMLANKSVNPTFAINILPAVCQIRLDFLDFELAINKTGDCLETDYLEILSSRDPTGVLGNGNGRICGRNTGQHMYINIRSTDMLVLHLRASGSAELPYRANTTDQSYKFNVKITQIFCNDTNTFSGTEIGVNLTSAGENVGMNGSGVPQYYTSLKAPSGCLLYFTEPRGVIQSWNYDNVTQFSGDYHYNICFKSPHNVHGLSIKAESFSLPQAQDCNNTTCCTGSDSESWVGVDEGSTPNNTISNKLYFCGQQFGVNKRVYVDHPGPHKLEVFSKAVKSGSNISTSFGFRLNYQLTSFPHVS